MASFGRVTVPATSMQNELTVALASMNFDFSLIRVDAPEEYHGLRDSLSINRLKEAEEGQFHATARRLGGLFGAIIPPIPNLIAAYGTRASEISSSLKDQNQARFCSGIFQAQAGPDGTSIWAAATSGKDALAVHLLACLLARVWRSPEAISIWAEIVDRRAQEIRGQFDNLGSVEVASINAAGQIFTRQQLAAWDASARSWLQTADAANYLKQTQLNLIINNVGLPVNHLSDPYASVTKAWISALSGMEKMAQGIPQ